MSYVGQEIGDLYKDGIGENPRETALGAIKLGNAEGVVNDPNAQGDELPIGRFLIKEMFRVGAAHEDIRSKLKELGIESIIGVDGSLINKE